MYDRAVSAPGKLFLCGEYAVLEKAPAVLTSVDRRVVARPLRANIPQSRLITDVKEAVGRFLCARSGAPVGQLPNIDIDSRGFSLDRMKLGIGSSAAVSAAVTGALFEWAGVSIDDTRDDILQVASSAHRTYQQGKGSGADVAVSVMGGTLLFQADGAPVALPPPIGSWVFLWTGQPASTVSLVGEVHALRAADGASFQRVMEPLVVLSRELASAFSLRDLTAIIELTSAYGDAMDRLGRAAGVSIRTEAMEWLQAQAKDCGGASKPSGAGGGDVALAVFPDADRANTFRERCRQRDVMALDFTTHVDGLSLTM